MTDKLGQVVRKGDCVRYWHKVNGNSIPEIGEIIGFVKYGLTQYDEAMIERKNYNNTNVSYRKSSGLTKISKAEAVLWKMEQFAFEEI